MFSHPGKWGGGDMNPDPKRMSQEMRLRGSVACKNAKQTKDTKVVRFPCSDGWQYVYMRVVLNSFIWKTPSSPKKKFFRRTFANSMFIFRGTCWPRFLRKTWMCDIMISSNCSRRLIPCHTSFCGRCT